LTVRSSLLSRVIHPAAALAVALSTVLFSTPAAAAAAEGSGSAPTTGSAAPTSGTAAPTAAGQIQWGISPRPDANGPRSAFDFLLAPGQSVSDTVAVSNLGTSPVTLSVYATDALNTADGAFTLLPAAEQATGAGSWIVLDAHTVKVEPGKQVEVPFTLRVPADATPGDHAAGIVASRMVEGVGENNAKVAVDQRVGSRVYLRVDGPLTPALDVSGLSASYSHPWYPFGGSAATVDYALTNTGNVRLNGTAQVRLTGPFGVALGSPQSVPISQLLPGSALAGTLTVPGVVPLGSLTAHLEVDAIGATDEESVALPTVSASSTVPAIPWLIVGVLVVLLALLVLAPIRRRRRRRKATAAVIDEMVGAGAGTTGGRGSGALGGAPDRSGKE